MTEKLIKEIAVCFQDDLSLDTLDRERLSRLIARERLEARLSGAEHCLSLDYGEAEAWIQELKHELAALDAQEGSPCR